MQLNMDGAAVKHPRTEGRDEPRLQLLARLVDKTAESRLEYPQLSMIESLANI